MNEDLQLKLQAYADGELNEREAREVGDFLSKNAGARALVAELQNTRAALGGFETDIKLPESREFYWSKIAREIESAEKSGSPVSAAPWVSHWRRFLLPAGALAALVLAALLAGVHLRRPATTEVEVAMAGSDPFTYHDYASGTTLVWLSYPAENDFADIESDDTLD